MQFNALVLNADFRPLSHFPLSTIRWQDAVTGVFQDKFAVVAEYDREVHSPSRAMRIPSVVALRDYIPTPRHVPFTRFNVFLRDKFTCQYCGEKFDPRDLRFDHVHPRSKGGMTSWANIVAACEPCNTRKGNREGMRPLRPPHVPTPGQLVKNQLQFPPRHLHESWLDYLYWDSPLEA